MIQVTVDNGVNSDCFGYTRNRWELISAEIGISLRISEACWDCIVSRYNESTRFYHTLVHIADMLRSSSMYSSMISDRTVVDLAIFFHDIIYDSRSNTNEEDSAKMFRFLLADYISADIIDKVVWYIMQTKTHMVQVNETPDNDLWLFLDIDMGVLGAERPLYIRYCTAIRAEYEHVDERLYRVKRRQFLLSVLDEREHIYATDAVRADCEQIARSNMQWECEVLADDQRFRDLFGSDSSTLNCPSIV